MKKCLFCGANRFNRPKYCSVKCTKRAWYAKRAPNSYFNNSDKFWNTETGRGFLWEKRASKLLGAEHLEFNGSGADLLWNGLAVDVKCANVYRRKNKRGAPVVGEQTGVWVFNRGKEKEIDFFMCFCLENDRLVKTLFIPGKDFPKSGAVIGKKSRYDVFLFRKK